MYLPSGTDGSKSKRLIRDVIPHFCSWQQFSNIVQDSSPSKTPPAVQINLFFCDVIFLNSSWKRSEIYSCWRKDTVLDRGIHKALLLVANIKSFICDVIPDSHPIGGRRNRTINTREVILTSKWSDSSVMWYLYIADEKGERFNAVAWRITYLTEVFRKRDSC